MAERLARRVLGLRLARSNPRSVTFWSQNNLEKESQSQLLGPTKPLILSG